jgi:hypothetical protein
MQSISFKIYVIVTMFGFLQTGVGNAADSFCKITLFADKSLQTVKEQFSVYDKIYLQSFCQHLLPGEYELTAVWHTPSGLIQRQDIQTFNLQVMAGYSAFFWLKLHKKSPFEDASSNSSFSDKYFGEWTVNVYVNEHSVGSAKFTLH